MRRVQIASNLPSPSVPPSPFPLPSLALLTSLLLGACGGGGASPDAGLPPGPPTVEVVFPHVGGLTDAPTLRVRGTASGAAGVVAVTVAGVAATSGDGFATWEAVVPLALGETTLDTLVLDTTGVEVSGPSVVVERTGAIGQALYDVAFDAVAKRAYVVDGEADALLTYDEVTGQSSVVASDQVGSGSEVALPVTLALDAGGGRLFWAPSGQPEIHVADLASGVRTLVTGAGAGSGPALGSVTNLAYDAALDRVYAACAGALTVFAVDPTTGARSVVTGAGVGAGPSLTALNDVARDAQLPRLLISGKAQGQTAIMAVDLATGDRTVLSGAGVGAGPDFIGAFDIALDEAQGRCFVAQNSYPANILVVDLATGTRATVPLAGPHLVLGAMALAYDALEDRLVMADLASAGLGAVDLATGETSALWVPRRGLGATLEDASDLALLPGGTQALSVEAQKGGALVFIDLASGDRSVLNGGGTACFHVGALALDAANGRALMAASIAGGDGIVAVDLATGTRSLVSGPTLGGGPLLVDPVALALDASGSRLHVADAALEALLTVDLATGDRTLVSDAATGSGPLFEGVRGLAFDAVHSRLLVSGPYLGEPALFAVDPSSGARLLLSSNGLGTGASLGFARSILTDVAGLDVVVDGVDYVLGVDVLSGDRTVVSGLGVGSGPAISVSADELAHAGPPGVVLLHDDLDNALLLLDTVTGERIIASK